MAETRRQQNQLPAGQQGQVPVLSQPRLPYHPAIKDRFGIDKSDWKALCEIIHPNAESTESVILALAYCKARKLDPFKRLIHIVPIWDKKKRAYVDTIWPGIGEMRTTAHRTKSYAGRDQTEFGPDQKGSWKKEGKNDQFTQIDITYPEWARITVYRMLGTERCAFPGPTVYWLEDVSLMKGNIPNPMWQKRPRGQLEKVAEAAALRQAFPEEVGNDYIDAEAHISEPETHRPATFTETAKDNAEIIEAEMGSETVEVEEPTKGPETERTAPNAVDTPETAITCICTHCDKTSTTNPSCRLKDGNFQCPNCLNWTLEPDADVQDQVDADEENFLHD